MTGRDDWQSPSLSGVPHARKSNAADGEKTSRFVNFYVGHDTSIPDNENG